MLRVAAMTIGVSLLAPGCLWEPIQQAPVPGNGDTAPVIQAAAPSSNQLFLTGSGNDPCVARVGLPAVFSPRAAPLKASFFLNFDLPTNVEALSIDGQTQFALQSGGDPQAYFLPNQLIHIDDFITQLNGQTNVLQVFVGDDLDNCPYPSSVSQTVQASPTSDQTLNCYTTSWTWVIEPFGCPVLEGF